MKLEIYLMMMFSISALLYFMGEQSVLQTSLIAMKACAGGSCSVGDFISTGVLIALALSLGVVLVGSAILNFGAFYIIPLYAVVFIMNVAVFPLSSVFSGTSGMPDEIRLPIVVFFNLLLLMTIYGEVRGR